VGQDDTINYLKSRDIEIMLLDDNTFRFACKISSMIGICWLPTIRYKI